MSLIPDRVQVDGGRDEGRGEGQRVDIVGVVVFKEKRSDLC